MAQCTATAKSTGERCRRRAITGRSTCRFHGGKTPRGFDLPQTKHGRYSKDLPTRLQATYDESRTDPKLLELTHEIALLDSRLVELTGKIDSGEAHGIWRALSAAKRTMQEAKTQPKRLAALEEILALIDRGAEQWAIWQDLAGMIDRRRKLVETESRRQDRLKTTYMVSEVYMMLQLILHTLTENHADDSTIRAVKDAIRPILAGGPGAVA